MFFQFVGHLHAESRAMISDNPFGVSCCCINDITVYQLSKAHSSHSDSRHTIDIIIMWNSREQITRFEISQKLYWTSTRTYFEETTCIFAVVRRDDFETCTVARNHQHIAINTFGIGSHRHTQWETPRREEDTVAHTHTHTHTHTTAHTHHTTPHHTYIPHIHTPHAYTHHTHTHTTHIHTPHTYTHHTHTHTTHINTPHTYTHAHHTHTRTHTTHTYTHHTHTHTTHFHTPHTPREKRQ